MKLKIDIFTDYVCQFCYIGKREIENAIENTGMQEMVDVHYHSYQLTPDAPTEATTLFKPFAYAHFGRPKDQIDAMLDGNVERAKGLGLKYDFDGMFYTNTLMAHRVSKYALAMGKDKAFNERLFYAHFTENKFISDAETLGDLGAEVGLDRDEIIRVAEDNNAYLKDVQDDINYANQIGVRGVPFYVFNDQYAISGAQPNEVFVNLLEQLKTELNLKAPLKVVGDADDVCGPDGCLI